MKTYQEYLNLFMATYKRQPKDGNEFAKWCEFVDSNSNSTNSRRII